MTLKIDIGCGKNKKEGFVGMDILNFPGVEIVCDAGKEPWPFEDESVDEAHASHFVEHLGPKERIHFVNELYRVLKKGAKCLIVTPHWASSRAYGDLTHAWPPVSEFWYFYLNKDWRAVNAPHNLDYKCDFDATWGYALNTALMSRNQEFQQFAISFYKEAAQDLIATVVKK